MELWSSVDTHYPVSTTSLVQIATTTTGVQGVLDTSTGGTNTLGLAPEVLFSVNPATGRMTYSFSPVTGYTARQFVAYLTGTSTGYLIETTANSGNGFGYLEAQTDLPYSSFQGGTYLATTVLPPSISPISLLPAVTVSGGAFGGGFSGQYALNSTTGRGLAELSRDVFGGSGLVFYIINDSKLVVMGNGANAINTQIGYLFY
jgi:hypothetical protein